MSIMPEYRFNVNNIDNIPHDLLDGDSWVMWRWEWNGKKWSKPPYVPNADVLKKADKTKPEDCRSFETAIEIYKNTVEEDAFHGVGRVITGDIVALDVDRPYTDDVCQGLIQTYPAVYWEQSPSGNLRGLCRGKFPDEKSRKVNVAGISYEMYHANGQYVTVTGDVVGRKISSLSVQQEFINAAYKTLIDGFQAVNSLIKAYPKFQHLWDGDDSDYGNNQSNADYNFVLYLMGKGFSDEDIEFYYYASNRPQEREENKWGSKRGQGTYGSGTIDKARKYFESKQDEQESGNEKGDKNIFEMREKAKASARAAAHRGDLQEAAIARVKKQWPVIAEDAELIVSKAYEWWGKMSPGNVIQVDGLLKRSTDIDDLNQRYSKLQAPGMAACIVEREEKRIISDKELELRLGGEVYIRSIGDDAQPKYMTASKCWKESYNKHVYNRIVFHNREAQEGEFNLFTGFGIQPEKGEWTLISEYLQDIICNGNSTNYEVLLDLIAWQLQNVGVPSKVATVLISKEQQIGKSTLLEHILLPIWGQSGHLTLNIDSVVGNFNACTKGKGYVALEEAFFNGDRKAADQFKGIITARKTIINEKFLPRIELPSAVNIWAASNRVAPVYLEEEDARYWILPVNPAWKGLRREKWNPLYNQIASGGVEAFLYDMLRRDVSGFIPQDDVPIQNAAHTEGIWESLPASHPAKWLSDCLEAGAFPYIGLAELTVVSGNSRYTYNNVETQGGAKWVEGASIGGMVLYESYKRWVATLRGHGVTTVRPRGLWELLTKCGFEVKAEKRILPALDECRTLLNALYESGVKGVNANKKKGNSLSVVR